MFSLNTEVTVYGVSAFIREIEGYPWYDAIHKKYPLRTEEKLNR